MKSVKWSEIFFSTSRDMNIEYSKQFKWTSVLNCNLADQSRLGCLGQYCQVKLKCFHGQKKIFSVNDSIRTENLLLNKAEQIVNFIWGQNRLNHTHSILHDNIIGFFADNLGCITLSTRYFRSVDFYCIQKSLLFFLACRGRSLFKRHHFSMVVPCLSSAVLSQSILKVRRQYSLDPRLMFVGTFALHQVLRLCVF